MTMVATPTVETVPNPAPALTPDQIMALSKDAAMTVYRTLSRKVDQRWEDGKVLDTYATQRSLTKGIDLWRSLVRDAEEIHLLQATPTRQSALARPFWEDVRFYRSSPEEVPAGTFEDFVTANRPKTKGAGGESEGQVKKDAGKDAATPAPAPSLLSSIGTIEDVVSLINRSNEELKMVTAFLDGRTVTEEERVSLLEAFNAQWLLRSELKGLLLAIPAKPEGPAPMATVDQANEATIPSVTVIAIPAPAPVEETNREVPPTITNEPVSAEGQAKAEAIRAKRQGK